MPPTRTPSGQPRSSGTSTFDEAARLVLDHLHAEVPMAVWTVSRVMDGQQVHLDVTPNELDVAVGDGSRWEGSLGHAMWTEGGPRVAPDVSRVRQYATTEEAREHSVASFVGIPLLNSDDTLFGTVCGQGTEAREDSFVELGPRLELMGQLLSVVRDLDDQAVWLSRQLEASLQEAETDPLTGQRNLRAWRRACEIEEARHHRLGDHASIVVLDLDGLREVNDREGHPAGDAMLRRAAAVIRAGRRRTDVVARVGGDEFAVLCPQTTAAGVTHVVHRLRDELAAAGLTAAIGSATLDRADTMAETEARAEAAMRAEKDARRHR